MRVVVGVYLVRGPMGGLSWHYLQYALGLARLGHDVWVVEDSGDHEWCCYDPVRGAVDSDATYGLEYTRRVCDRLGLGERWAYHDVHGGGWRGAAAERIMSAIAGADLFLNLSGATVMRDWLREIPRRAFVDTDPAFRQVRTLTEAADRELAEAHTSFHTFGELWGAPGCRIPDDGLPWRPTRQPVVLDAWPVTDVPAAGPFTTVMRWDSYAVREWDGLALGMKSRSFDQIADLPSRVAAPLELALGGPSPADDLVRRGWRVVDPQVAIPDPWAFQRYLQGSAAELTVAKHGYVASCSGWFSERSAAYLASGRAVVAQDTGFSELLPCGEGLIGFDDADGAAAAVEAIRAEPERHARAARAIAEEHFDARRVLDELLEDAC